MEQHPLIPELVSRAKAAGLTVKDLCKRAGLAPSTFNRWRAGKTWPNSRSLETVQAVIERAEHEQTAEA